MSVESEKRRIRKNLATTSHLPVASYSYAVVDLRRPFTPEAVRFRVLACWNAEGGDMLTHAICVAYIDARLVIARLNLVCPDLWSEDPPDRVGTGIRTLTVRMQRHSGACDGTVTHWGVGEGTGKTLDSDALKRAAVHLGVGESLYAVPKVQIDRLEDRGTGDLLLRDWTEDDKPWLKLTLAGERYCRDRYRKWLLDTGIKAFGKPIDHGDVADCPGMVETTEPPPATTKGGRSKNGRGRSTRPAETLPEPMSTGAEVAEVALATLLATVDDLTDLRVECEGAMDARGFTVAHRLDELRSAKDRRGLEALLVTIGNLPTEQAPDENTTATEQP